ncbi:unnamed protein product, partial [Heterotrigona itama]
YLMIYFSRFKVAQKFTSSILIFLRLIIYSIFTNFFRLFPYIFPLTRHLIFNLSISLSLWLRFFSIFITYIIQPLTLSIRLSSNLISGHPILILLRNFIINFLFILPFNIIIQNVLLFFILDDIFFIKNYVRVVNEEPRNFDTDNNIDETFN